MFINIKIQIKLPVFTNSNNLFSNSQLVPCPAINSYLIMHSTPLSTIHTSSSSQTGSPNSVHPPPPDMYSAQQFHFVVSHLISHLNQCHQHSTPRCSLYPHHMSTLHANKLPGHSAAAAVVASKSSLVSLDRSHCPFTLQCVYVWLRYLSPHPPRTDHSYQVISRVSTNHSTTHPHVD